jgi:copper chaperone CopZ
MKKNILNLILIGLATFVLSPSVARTIAVDVKGMVCSFCAQGIEKSFMKEEAVQKVLPNLDKNLVSLEIKEGKDLSDEIINKRLKDSGYTVGNIKRLDF